MALTPRLDLRQSQTLVMTPQLQQAIRLLQLSNLELAEYVERELERNPLLERDDGAEANGEAVAEAPADAISGLDGDYDNLWNSDRGTDRGLREGWQGGDDAAAVVERTVAEATTLRDHLINQVNVDIADAGERLIALHLVDLLDEAGYLDEDPAAIAARLGCPPATVEAVLARVQTLDPPGVFARSLAECLALQLRDRGRLDGTMARLLEHLDLVADGRAGEAAQRLGIEPAALASMLAEIRSLHPKPGLVFDHEVVQTVIPDVLVRRGADGTWLVELNSDTLPRLLVDRRYYARISGQARCREDREYIAECLSSANWLVKSLDQRATTILRVASEIVRWQEGFLEHGIRRLRPLILRDIAAAIDMHESTVSRVTTNKFMATPRGIFEMRYFFTNAIAGTGGDGEGHSAEAIRHRIKTLIAGEEGPGALSDDRIVKRLRDEGVEIARRTVAKYREALGIPSSMERRRRARQRA